MKTIKTISELRRCLEEARAAGKKVGLVPTMGYLHEGHMSLIRRARADNGVVIVSIFVNPTQFGPGEDLERYPRDLARDSQLCSEAGADVIFAPEAAEMYPEGFQTYVEVCQVSQGLCGASRPGHFRGVATVVAKLLNIVGPCRAYFGQKDAQQLAVIRRMAEDLNMPVEIVPMPIVRESDGLAMSSRNTYLDEIERASSLVLSRALKLARRLIEKGERRAAELHQAMRTLIETEEFAEIDYVAIVNHRTMQPVETVDSGTLIALAVRIGRTRLIDNMLCADVLAERE